MYRRFWRIEFGFAKGSWSWGIDSMCGGGCRILSLGPVFITWLGKQCN